MCLVVHSQSVWQSLHGGLPAVLGHVHVAVVVQVIGGQGHLPGDGCGEHVGLIIFCAGEGLCEAA